MPYPPYRCSAQHINRWAQTYIDPILRPPHRPIYVSTDESFCWLHVKRKKQPDGTAGKKCLCFRVSIKLFIIPAGMGKGLAGHGSAQEECRASAWHVGRAFKNHLQAALLLKISTWQSWDLRVAFSFFLHPLPCCSSACLPAEFHGDSCSKRFFYWPGWRQLDHLTWYSGRVERSGTWDWLCREYWQD